MEKLEKSMLEAFFKDNDLDYDKEFYFSKGKIAIYKGVFTCSSDSVSSDTVDLHYTCIDDVCKVVRSMQLEAFLTSLLQKEIQIINIEELKINSIKTNIKILMSQISKEIEKIEESTLKINKEIGEDKIKEVETKIFDLLIDLYKDYLNLDNKEEKDDTIIDLDEITDEILEEHPTIKATISKARKFGFNPMYMGILDTETNEMISLKEFLKRVKERESK